MSSSFSALPNGKWSDSWGCPPKITVFTLKQKAPQDNCCYELLWNKIDPEAQNPYYFKDHVFLISAAQKLLRPFTSAAPVKLLSVCKCKMFVYFSTLYRYNKARNQQYKPAVHFR